MLRSRIAITVIGVIVIGSASAIGVLVSSANGNPSTRPTTALGNATATAIAASTVASTSAATASPTPTTAPPRSTRPPSGQVIDLHCTIASNPDDNQFTCNDNTTLWTVQVNNNTIYEGAAPQSGLKTEISGVITGSATFLAYKVNTESGK